MHFEQENAHHRGEKMKSTIAVRGVLIILTILLITLFNQNRSNQVNASNTCPDNIDGWIKIDSNDLSSYPVELAIEYCFKAGSDNSQGCTGGLFNYIPANGFGGTTDGIKYCGLSHWSYKIGEVEPTPTLVPTIEPTSEPTPEPTSEPTPEPTAEPTTEPTHCPDPTATPTKTPSTNKTDDNSSNNSSGENKSEGEVLGVSTSGMVLGATTYANAGTAIDNLLLLSAFSSLSISGYAWKKWLK